MFLVKKLKLEENHHGNMLVLLIILIQRVLKKILFIHTHIFITLVDQEY